MSRPLADPEAPPETPALSELVYRHLKAIAHARMAGERAGHPLHTTALVHEALMKLTRDGQIRLEERPEFFRSAAAAMRQILIDHARAARRQKRGGEAKRVELDLAELSAAAAFDPGRVLAVDESLARLEAQDARAASLVRLRFYAGLTMEEAAEAAGLSLRGAERLWTYARAWLWRDLGPGAGTDHA